MFLDFLFDPLFLGLLVILTTTAYILWILLAASWQERKQLQQKIDELLANNAVLWKELEIRYSHQRSEEWIDALAREVFGEE